MPEWELSYSNFFNYPKNKIWNQGLEAENLEVLTLMDRASDS